MAELLLRARGLGETEWDMSKNAAGTFWRIQGGGGSDLSFDIAVLCWHVTNVTKLLTDWLQDI
jgi:hypothetical protein